jgi:hypothetical protein
MQKDVAQYVKECAVCQGAATPRHRPYGELQSLSIPQQPFSDLAMDFNITINYSRIMLQTVRRWLSNGQSTKQHVIAPVTVCSH